MWFHPVRGTIQPASSIVGRLASADFGEYMIQHMESGERNFTKLFLGYYRDYFSKGLAYQAKPATAA
jgi:hypothetical protein